MINIKELLIDPNSLNPQQLAKFQEVKDNNLSREVALISVDGYPCIVEIDKDCNLISDIVTPLKEDGTRYPIQKIKIVASFVY